LVHNGKGVRFSGANRSRSRSCFIFNLMSDVGGAVGRNWKGLSTGTLIRLGGGGSEGTSCFWLGGTLRGGRMRLLGEGFIFYG